MFHVFISYAHEDGDPYRKAIINLLQENGFQDDDYWYDKRDITVGEEWRSEIDKALNESFLVIIVLTKGAIKSHSVTYEWSRAIGDEIKVIPILFEDLNELPEKLKHPLFSYRQYIDWKENDTPKKLIEDIKQYREMPPDKIYLAQLILGKATRFRLLARIAFWLYPYIDLNLVSEDLVSQLIIELKDETINLFNKVLPEILVDKYSAFTSKQARTSRILAKNLKLFWSLFYTPSIAKEWVLDLPITSELIAKVDDFREKEIEPLLTTLEDGLIPDGSYKRLDYHLKAISKAGTQGMPTDVYPPTGEYLFNSQFNVVNQTLSVNLSNDVDKAVQQIKSYQTDSLG